MEIPTGIPEHRNSKYYRLNSVENNHGSWLLVGILQLAGNQLLGILKIPVVVQYNTVGIWLPVPVVIYFQSLTRSTRYYQRQVRSTTNSYSSKVKYYYKTSTKVSKS